MRGRVFTYEDKCKGCNKCISICPVDSANHVHLSFDGTRRVYVDSNYCIACGSCLTVCDHGARDYIDDSPAFFHALASREPITVVVAPAAQLHFKELRRLFGWLKAMGVSRIYDVSLGADIATWAYLKAMKALSLSSVIAQPCASIVNYIERYMPELLPSLAPIQSPLMCLATYLRQHEGVTGEIAFLSPCIAKAEEIRDPNTKDLVQYNVTFAKLADWMEARGIELSDFEETDFDGMPSGIGHVYSRPGGLGETVRVTNRELWIRQVETVEYVYPYLHEYLDRREQGQPLPELVDILNCYGGCNLGTGTRRDVAQDDVDAKTNAKKRQKAAEQITETAKGTLYAIQEYFDRELDWRDFRRDYTDRKLEHGFFTDEDLESTFLYLNKKTEMSRNINCHACGYGSCHRFAQALKLRINVRESCIDYERSKLKIDRLTTLLNYGGLEDAMELCFRRYRVEPYPLALIMMDVDDFKQVNDTYGHNVGDEALKAVAEAITKNLRAADIAGRRGGDEFMVILPDADEEDAHRIAERIRDSILRANVLPDGMHFSASAGIAQIIENDTPTFLFQRADKALYEAKKHKGTLRR